MTRAEWIRGAALWRARTRIEVSHDGEDWYWTAYAGDVPLAMARIEDGPDFKARGRHAARAHGVADVQDAEIQISTRTHTHGLVK